MQTPFNWYGLCHRTFGASEYCYHHANRWRLFLWLTTPDQKEHFVDFKNPSFNLVFPETDPGSRETFSQDVSFVIACVNLPCTLRTVECRDVRNGKISPMSNRKTMCQMKKTVFFSPRNPHTCSYLKSQPSKSLFVSFHCHIQRQSRSQHKSMTHATSLKISTLEHCSIQNRNQTEILEPPPTSWEISSGHTVMPPCLWGIGTSHVAQIGAEQAGDRGLEAAWRPAPPCRC